MNEINQFLMSHGGPLLFAVVFAEQAGLPLPAAPWLLAAGALAAGGKLNPIAGIAITALAAVIADSIWFYVGRRGGQRVLRLFCRLSLARNTCVGRSQNLFARHGLQWIVAAKFLPGLGAVMPPLAGTLGMKAGRFLLLDGLGSLIYATFYFTIGFIFHNQLGQVMGMLSRFGLSALVLGLILAMSYITFKYLHRKQPSQANAQRQLSGLEAKKKARRLAEATDLQVGLAFRNTHETRASRSANTLSLPVVSLVLVRDPAERGENELMLRAPLDL